MELSNELSSVIRDIGLSPTWLVLILIAFPLSVLFLGELAIRARRAGLEYAGSLSLLRNVALPLLALYFLATRLSDFPADSLELRVLVTLTALVTLVAVLGVVNGVLFSGGATSVTKVPKLFLDLGRVILIGIGIAVILSTVWGANLGELATALGVSSIVIGLALQDTLGNLFSGITLLYEQPFSEGDFIKVDDFEGRVIEVNWRAVRLKTREDDLIVLPHTMVAQSALVNRSRPIVEYTQQIELGFSYHDAPNRVKAMLREVVRDTPGILEWPAPEFKTLGFAASSVTYEVEYAVANYGVREEIADDFTTRIWYAAKRHGITFPFPTRTIYSEDVARGNERRHRAATYELERAADLLSSGTDHRIELDPEHADLSSYGRGEVVLAMRQRDPGLYIVLEGELSLYATEADGDRAEIAHLRAGDLFTEIVMPGRRENVIEAVCTHDCKLIRLTESTLRRLVNRNEALARRIEGVNGARRKQVAALEGGGVGV